jgi:hypothetical protein
VQATSSSARTLDIARYRSDRGRADDAAQQHRVGARGDAPKSINHYNLFRAAEISGWRRQAAPDRRWR